jgi:DNA-binding NarL/FixJ family response regulator
VLLLQGRSRKQIASALEISENTVKVYAGHVYIDFNVRSHTELLALALRTPWLRAMASPKEVGRASPKEVTK